MPSPKWWHTPEGRARYAREQRAAAKADRTCDWCGESIVHMRRDARWCSKRCGNAGVKKDRLDRGIPAWKADASGQFARRCKRYGITPERFEEMLAEQGGKCAVCGTDSPGDNGFWAIDHDHQCCAGKKACGECVRGLLCNRCNVGIGMLGDDVDHLMAAAAYILARQNVLLPGGFA